MSRDKSGSGGLSFGPPPTYDQRPADIGFAPDIDELVQESSASLEVTDPGPRTARGGMTTGRNVSYPLAEACLHRLLGTSLLPDAEANEGGSKNETNKVKPDVHPFVIGPAVMRAPPDLARPPAEPAAPVDDGGSSTLGHTDALLEDLVDVLLVGEDSGKPEVHLSFKPEVFGGLYLRLERRDDGLFAHFSVPDDHARRSVQGHIDDLLARLSSAGFSICGSSLQVQENP